MKRGRPPTERNKRFAAIPRMRNGCIYAAQLTNGVVKVGYSRTPSERMKSLRNEAESSFACGLGEFLIGPDLPTYMAPYKAELELIASVRAHGAVAIEGRAEYFPGFDFAVACELVTAISEKFLGASKRGVEGADPFTTHGSVLVHGADRPFFVSR